MSRDRDSFRLLEEWMRTVDDYFKSCIELQRLAASGNQDDTDKAKSEARELKLIAINARRRYRSFLRHQQLPTGTDFLNADVNCSTCSVSSAAERKPN